MQSSTLQIRSCKWAAGFAVRFSKRPARVNCRRRATGSAGSKPARLYSRGAYALPAGYIIHTAGPVWHGGGHGEKELLENCYRNSLDLAVRNGLRSIAFPIISGGIYGYPKAEAIHVAVRTIREFLRHAEDELAVYLVVFDEVDMLSTLRYNSLKCSQSK